MDEQVASPREVPHSIEAEQCVLGAVLMDNNLLGRITSSLQEADFWRPAHQHILGAMVELFGAGENIDPVTLSNTLQAHGHLEDSGGLVYLGELGTVLPTTASLPHYIDIVKNKAVLRGLLDACNELAKGAYEQPRDARPLLDRAQQLVFDLGRDRSARDTVQLKYVLKEAWDKLDELSRRAGDIVGVPTGYPDLDRMTAGLQPQELVILAARPSMGKTALALNLVHNAATQGYPCAVFSLEMGKASLGMRLYSIHGRVPADHLRKAELTDDDWKALAQANAELGGAPIWIDDTPAISLQELRSKARRLVFEENVRMLVLDYLQLMGTDPRIDSREQQIATLARGLKGLAKELDVPVVILSQLNRALEQRKDKRPMLSDLRESGAIEQDADVVMFIHRDDYYNREDSDRPNIAEVEIAKQRNGPTGRVELYFHKEFGRFDSYAGDST